ncbi:MAG TPA: ABC transporter ATP-binding protein [Terriglobales bacterium]|nr:ABC transporter ATP-binding protein [Terriglobales bacterium]
MSFIELDKITKFYGSSEQQETYVLSDVSLAIEEGEFVCLMGPSGSGKSTLLTILGAMNHPSAGHVLIDEVDVYALTDERRADFRREYLGFVFQQHHLMPYLTAIENVMLPLATVRLNSAEKTRRAVAALAQVGLAEKRDRLPNQLSGGEQGRVAIARALVNNPPVILADEPTGTLDSKTGEEIMRVFLRLNHEGQTIFMVTHNSDNAAAAHRVLHIRDGKLEERSNGDARTIAFPSPASSRASIQHTTQT